MVYVMMPGYLGKPQQGLEPIPVPVEYVYMAEIGPFGWICQDTLGKADLYVYATGSGLRYDLFQMPAADLLGLLVQSGTPKWSS